MEDQDFAEKEFRDICKDVQDRDGYDLELILRVRNFKLSRPITWDNQEEQSWKSVVGVVNEAIQEAKGSDDVCAALGKLCEIYGVGVPLASVLLAASDPKRFTIIDDWMFKFFQLGEKAYEAMKEIFNIDTDDEKLRGKLIKVKEEFDKAYNSPWVEIYPRYLEMLGAIQDMASLANLRDVEWKIWQWSKSHPVR